MIDNPRRLAEILEATTSFVGTVDASGRPLWVNRAGRALCGLRPEDPLPGSIADFHPRWAAWRVLSEGVAVAARDGVWRHETAVLGPDGAEVPVAQVLVAHYDDAGELESVSTVMRDLRESRRLTAELRDQARLLAAVGQAVIATDPDGRVEYWNPAAERLYGWTAAEATGRDVTELTVSAAEERQAEKIMAALRTGEGWSGTFQARTKEGTTFPIWVTDTPVFDERGELIKIIGVSTDLSELHAVREQAQRRADQQAAVARLGQEILDADGLEEVVQRACQLVANVLGADLAELFELEAGRQRLWLRAGVGWPHDEVGRATVAAGGASLPGYVLQCDAPVNVPDVASETRFAMPELVVQQGVASGMSVRVSPRDGPYGVLGVHSRWPRSFSEDDAAFLHSVANLVASAVSHHRTARELEQLALYDPLTGLANRARATGRLAERLVDAREGSGRVGVLMLDLDGFRLVNDGLSPRHGDRLLQQVGRCLHEAVGALGGAELVSRLDSDEFAVLCPELHHDESAAVSQCLELARWLGDAVSGHYDLAPATIYVTVSVGVALSLDHTDARELLRDAQAAVSDAKQRKRGGVCVYDRHMRARAARQVEVATELREALGRDELAMCYQAEIDLGTGRLFGIEALLRWHHPTRGVLAPGEFLSVAEDTGLIVPVGVRALHLACHDVATVLPFLARSRVRLAVNVGAAQLDDDTFVAEMDAALAASGLPGRNLMVEITESALINNPETVAAQLAALRARDIQVAVDDFGTGYSSLTHLADFPIDVVKIDRSFVSGLARVDRHRQIVESVVRLAHTMHLTCVAEGVETPTQFSELRVLGCDVGQGYLWGPAQPASEIASWFDDEA